eukprot:IDg7913t1
MDIGSAEILSGWKWQRNSEALSLSAVAGRILIRAKTEYQIGCISVGYPGEWITPCTLLPTVASLVSINNNELELLASLQLRASRRPSSLVEEDSQKRDGRDLNLTSFLKEPAYDAFTQMLEVSLGISNWTGAVQLFLHKNAEKESLEDSVSKQDGTRQDFYPLLRMENFPDSLGGAKYFHTLD